MSLLAKQTASLNCLDLFAGVGGFSKAAIDIGINVRAAVEIDHHACESYRFNLINTSPKPPKLYEADIRILDPKKVALDAFPSYAKCDLILGGPPCQGFSVHRIKGSGVNDPRNELLFQYFAFVAELRPKLFLLENVPGILWERHKSFLNRFTEESEKIGYRIIGPTLLDARDYGVPQRRRRIFLLGIRNDLSGAPVWPPPPTHQSPTAIDRDPKRLPWESCKHVFRAANKNDMNDLHMVHGSELIEAFKNTPKNGGSRSESGRTLKCHANHDGHKDVYGRIDPSKPAPTMTTACVNPSKGRFVHPTRNHGITVRQAARIQTFPDDFVFTGGIIAAAKQIGNAVPIKLGHTLLQSLATYLIEERAEQIHCNSTELLASNA